MIEKRTICVSVFAEDADKMIERAMESAKDADVIELRLDHLSDGQIDTALAAPSLLPRPVIFTRRPVSQGGAWDVGREQRITFWHEMAKRVRPDGVSVFFDIEADIAAALHLTGQGLIISHHDFTGVPAEIEIIFEEMNCGDSTTKIAWSADDALDTVQFSILQRDALETGRLTVPIAMGEAGKWTRVLGPALGAPLTYASMGDGLTAAPGQISARDLRRLYRVNDLTEKTDVFGLLAGDTGYSLSPLLHNTAFASRGIDAVFIPLQSIDISGFFKKMVRATSREVELNFRGFAVSNPHKIAVIEHLDELDESAKLVGAVNTVSFDGAYLTGHNTDVEGFIAPLLERESNLKGSRAAIIGAGGAARAAALALSNCGCDVTFFARDTSRASEVGQRTLELAKADASGFDILVNATPLGTKGDLEGSSPLKEEQMRGVSIAYDLVYNPAETAFLAEARSAGARTIGGLEMLIRQAALQQKIWTGVEPDVSLLRNAVGILQ